VFHAVSMKTARPKHGVGGVRARLASARTAGLNHCGLTTSSALKQPLRARHGVERAARSSC
jgi:hypothetical protein